MPNRYRAFFDEYHRWELGTPLQSVILHEMFLHATNRGCKEVECMVCWGWQGSTLGLDPQAVLSAIELVGYQTSCKEIQDIYQSVFLLWRLPGLPSCGNKQRKRAIQDICSSLKSQMHRHGYPATTAEGSQQEEEQQPGLSRQEPYEEALRAAHQRVLDTAKALQSNIERLSLRSRGRSWTRSQTHSRSSSRSDSRSRSRGCSRDGS